MPSLEDAINSANAQVKAEEEGFISAQDYETYLAAMKEETKPLPDNAFSSAMDDMMDNIEKILADPRKAKAIIAAGLASATTYLLFYTDVPQTAVEAAGNAVPDSLSLNVG